jgi:hypothetical protein
MKGKEGEGLLDAVACKVGTSGFWVWAARMLSGRLGSPAVEGGQAPPHLIVVLLVGCSSCCRRGNGGPSMLPLAYRRSAYGMAKLADVDVIQRRSSEGSGCQATFPAREAATASWLASAARAIMQNRWSARTSSSAHFAVVIRLTGLTALKSLHYRMSYFAR